MKGGIARLVMFCSAIASVAIILLVWKHQDRKSAWEELDKFQIEVNEFAGETFINVSSDRLKNLRKLGELIRRAGRSPDGIPLSPAVLDLTGSPNLESLAGISALMDLRTIIAVDCPRLSDVGALVGVPALEQITLTDNRSLVSFSDLNLPSLVTLNLTGCINLVDLSGLELPNLKNLYLSDCRKLAKLDVGTYVNLEQLYVDSCLEIPKIQGLEKLASLTDLDVSNCHQLKNLDGLAGLSSLIVLDLRNVEIPDLSVIGKLPELRMLRLAGQGNITSLKPFSSLTRLTEIHLEACSNFVSLEGIPPSVTDYAGFTHCENLVSLDGIEKATNLKRLDVKYCRSLEDIESLKSLKSLVQLSLIMCEKITDVRQLEHNPNLAVVALGGSGVTPAMVEGLKDLFPPEKTIFDFSVLE